MKNDMDNWSVPEPRAWTLIQEQVEEYKQLYEEEFGEEISIAEARETATRLLMLYDLLYKPVPTGFPTQPPADDPGLPRIGFVAS